MIMLLWSIEQKIDGNRKIESKNLVEIMIARNSDWFPNYKSYRTHGIIKKKIESFSSRFSILYDYMSSDCDLYHTLSFKKLKAEPFISVSLPLLLLAFGAWYNQSRASDSEWGFGSSERQTAGCMWSLMDAHMPGSICVKLSEFVEGRWAIQLGQKKSNIFKLKFFLKNFLLAT